MGTHTGTHTHPLVETRGCVLLVGKVLFSPNTHQRHDCSFVRRYLPHAMVHFVCNKNSALRVHHNVHQLVEARSCTYPVCKARLPVASDYQDSAIECDLA